MSNFSPAEFDEKLIEALDNSLWYSARFDDSVVGEKYQNRISKGSRRGTSVYQTTSMITGEKAFVMKAGNTAYLYADKETVMESHRRLGVKEKHREWDRDPDAMVGTTAEQWWAWAADQLEKETNCSQSPPDGGEPKIDELLEVEPDISDHEWRTKEEGEEIARRVEERVQKDLDDFEFPGRIRIEFSTSYHGQGYGLRAGQAGWKIADRNDSFEEVLRKAKELIRSQEGSVKHWAHPSPSKGSTGEPYFDETG